MGKPSKNNSKAYRRKDKRKKEKVKRKEEEEGFKSRKIASNNERIKNFRLIIPYLPCSSIYKNFRDKSEGYFEREVESLTDALFIDLDEELAELLVEYYKEKISQAGVGIECNDKDIALSIGEALFTMEKQGFDYSGVELKCLDLQKLLSCNETESEGKIDKVIEKFVEEHELRQKIEKSCIAIGSTNSMLGGYASRDDKSCFSKGKLVKKVPSEEQILDKFTDLTFEEKNKSEDNKAVSVLREIASGLPDTKPYKEFKDEIQCFDNVCKMESNLTELLIKNAESYKGNQPSFLSVSSSQRENTLFIGQVLSIVKKRGYNPDDVGSVYLYNEKRSLPSSADLAAEEVIKECCEPVQTQLSGGSVSNKGKPSTPSFTIEEVTRTSLKECGVRQIQLSDKSGSDGVNFAEGWVLKGVDSVEGVQDLVRKFYTQNHSKELLSGMTDLLGSGDYLELSQELPTYEENAAKKKDDNIRGGFNKIEKNELIRLLIERNNRVKLGDFINDDYICVAIKKMFRPPNIFIDVGKFIGGPGFKERLQEVIDSIRYVAGNTYDRVCEQVCIDRQDVEEFFKLKVLVGEKSEGYYFGISEQDYKKLKSFDIKLIRNKRFLFGYRCNRVVEFYQHLSDLCNDFQQNYIKILRELIGFEVKVPEKHAEVLQNLVLCAFREVFELEGVNDYDGYEAFVIDFVLGKKVDKQLCNFLFLEKINSTVASTLFFNESGKVGYTDLFLMKWRNFAKMPTYDQFEELNCRFEKRFYEIFNNNVFENVANKTYDFFNYIRNYVKKLYDFDYLKQINIILELSASFLKRKNLDHSIYDYDTFRNKILHSKITYKEGREEGETVLGLITDLHFYARGGHSNPSDKKEENYIKSLFSQKRAEAELNVLIEEEAGVGQNIDPCEESLQNIEEKKLAQSILQCGKGVDKEMHEDLAAYNANFKYFIDQYDKNIDYDVFKIYSLLRGVCNEIECYFKIGDFNGVHLFFKSSLCYLQKINKKYEICDSKAFSSEILDREIVNEDGKKLNNTIREVVSRLYYFADSSNNSMSSSEESIEKYFESLLSQGTQHEIGTILENPAIACFSVCSTSL